MFGLSVITHVGIDCCLGWTARTRGISSVKIGLIGEYPRQNKYILDKNANMKDYLWNFWSGRRLPSYFWSWQSSLLLSQRNLFLKSRFVKKDVAYCWFIIQMVLEMKHNLFSLMTHNMSPSARSRHVKYKWTIINF